MFSFCGCQIRENGHSLQAFTERVNTLSDGWEIAVNGFIFDDKDKTFTKFFKFTDSEIMVQLEQNKSNELCALHIVFDNLTENNTQEIDFIKNIIFSFINNNDLTTDLLSEFNFDDAIFTKDINTKTIKNGNTELKVDVTEIGTIISVYQNIP